MEMWRKKRAERTSKATGGTKSITLSCHGQASALGKRRLEPRPTSSVSGTYPSQNSLAPSAEVVSNPAISFSIQQDVWMTTVTSVAYPLGIIYAIPAAPCFVPAVPHCVHPCYCGMALCTGAVYGQILPRAQVLPAMKGTQISSFVLTNTPREIGRNENTYEVISGAAGYSDGSESRSTTGDH